MSKSHSSGGSGSGSGTAGSASASSEDLQAALDAKDAEIAKLNKELALLEKSAESTILKLREENSALAKALEEKVNEEKSAESTILKLKEENSALAKALEEKVKEERSKAKETELVEQKTELEQQKDTVSQDEDSVKKKHPATPADGAGQGTAQEVAWKEQCKELEKKCKMLETEVGVLEERLAKQSPGSATADKACQSTDVPKGGGDIDAKDGGAGGKAGQRGSAGQGHPSGTDRNDEDSTDDSGSEDGESDKGKVGGATAVSKGSKDGTTNSETGGDSDDDKDNKSKSKSKLQVSAAGDHKAKGAMPAAAAMTKRPQAIVKRALVVIDVQNDFCEGGSLAVPGGSTIIPKINGLRACKWDAVVLTQDWHPANHTSFHSNNEGSTLFQEHKLPSGTMQMMWPDHCVEGSRGAEFCPDLTVTDNDCIIRKGQVVGQDSYSGFADDGGNETALRGRLEALEITDLYCCGLATDYCVNFTILDGLAAGFKVHAIVDCCRGIEEKGCEEKIKEWTAKGVQLTSSSALALDAEAAAEVAALPLKEAEAKETEAVAGAAAGRKRTSGVDKERAAHRKTKAELADMLRLYSEAAKALESAQANAEKADIRAQLSEKSRRTLLTSNRKLRQEMEDMEREMEVLEAQLTAAYEDDNVMPIVATEEPEKPPPGVANLRMENKRLLRQISARGNEADYLSDVVDRERATSEGLREQLKDLRAQYVKTSAELSIRDRHARDYGVLKQREEIAQAEIKRLEREVEHLAVLNKSTIAKLNRQSKGMAASRRPNRAWMSPSPTLQRTQLSRSPSPDPHQNQQNRDRHESVRNKSPGVARQKSVVVETHYCFEEQLKTLY